MKYSFDGITWINTSSTLFSGGLIGYASNGRLSDTFHLATDPYYQSGYNTLTVSTVQSS
jgi:hypothetical protein